MDSPTWVQEKQDQVRDAFMKPQSYGPTREVAALLLLAAARTEALIAENRRHPPIAETLAEACVFSIAIANKFSIRLATEDAESWPELTAPRSLLYSATQVTSYLYSAYESRSEHPASYLRTCLLQTLGAVHSMGTKYNVENFSSALSDALADAVEARKNDDQKVPDPTLSPALRGFRQEVADSACSFARAAKLWGAPGWRGNGSVTHYARRAFPSLLQFSERADAEKLDGYVLDLRPPGYYEDTTGLAREVGDVLRELRRLDPHADSPWLDVVETPGWQFSFARQRIFVTAFSDAYSTTHPRFARRSYLMLQPESSFSSHGIGGGSASSEKLKAKVRDNFSKKSIRYPQDLIDSRVEAHLYVIGEDERTWEQWWDGADDAGTRLF